jgi:ureidoglycolate amidohydrolase
MTAAGLDVDASEIMAQLDALARLSDTPLPAVTRVVYTASDLAAREFVTGLCTELGLSVRSDAIGNTFARWEGQEAHLSPVGTGSHIDAIPHSGRFDGTVGVIGGLAAIRALKNAGFQPLRPIELLIFTSEEPTRFGIGCLGSRALAGTMAPQALGTLTDADGRVFDDIRREAGFQGELASIRLPSGYYAAFVELHIEQGPLLEQAGVPIGIVTAIAAPAALRVIWRGEGGHAGTVLMNGRRDALCAAAQAILAVEESARSTGSSDTVATTGICRVHPGALNSIPDQVTLEIDIRDVDLTRRDRVLEAVKSAVESIAARRQVRAVTQCLSADPPASASPYVVEAIRAACRALGNENLPMVSRAYHDSLFMAGIAPTGMIFIPCKGGISHRPEEYSDPEAIARGVEVLALTLKELADHVR